MDPERDNLFRALVLLMGVALVVALVVNGLDHRRAEASTGSVRAAAGHGTVSAAPAASTATPVAHVQLTIATGLGPKGDYPAYIPSNITVPAHATVQVTIVDLDDATALPASYEKVMGTVGNTVTVQPIDPSNPNAPGKATTVSSLDPKTQIGHTFTIQQLGLNVPVASAAVETFTIRTGAAGVYHWQCFDPCGSGPAGWAGAMSKDGYMSGTLNVVA